MVYMCDSYWCPCILYFVQPPIVNITALSLL